VASACVYAPPSWDQPLGDTAIEIAEIDVEQQGGRLRVVLPRHSLAAITLSR
jgi:hypothetical protein